MQTRSHPLSARKLEQMIILFFVLAACSLIMVYVADPSMYTSTLLSVSGTHDRYPWPITLFLFIIFAFLIVLIFGVVHHWRWLFWLLLIAFGCSILEIPATLFQLGGLLPAFPAVFPLWYNVYRMGIALVETGMATWMVQIYRRAGVWGKGKEVNEPGRPG